MKLIISESKPEMKLSQFPAHGYRFHLTRVLHFKAQKQFQKELGLSINLQTKLSSERGVGANQANSPIDASHTLQPSFVSPDLVDMCLLSGVCCQY